jgi:hypothetical protein
MSEGFDTQSAETKKSFLPQRKPTKVAFIGAIQQSLVEYCGEFRYPTLERTKKHQLTDIIARKLFNFGLFQLLPL